MGGISMSIVLKDHATHAANPRNEDLFCSTPTQALLMDGSTNLGLYGDMPDASWFVEEFSRAFLKLSPERAAEERLALSVDAVADRCTEKTGTDPRTTNLTPSACLLLVEEAGELLEFYALGDCTAVVYYRDGRQPEQLRDDRIDAFDGKALAAAREMAAKTGMDLLDTVKTDAIRAILKDNRSKMNTPEGYWILAFSREALSHLRRWTVPKAEVAQLLLFTDGFDRLAGDFLRQPPEKPLKQLLKELRSAEEADKGCNRYPRFHTHDDACAALLEIR